MEHSVSGILRHLLKQLLEAIGFGREWDILDVAGIKINAVEPFQSAGILDQERIPSQVGDKPRLGSDVTSV